MRATNMFFFLPSNQVRPAQVEGSWEAVSEKMARE